MSPYREVEHTADWALRVWAPTMEELFVEAARGMYALAGARAAPESLSTRRIELNAGDSESLLVAWLQELLYFTETEGQVFTEYRIESLSPTRLQAEAIGGASERLDKVIKAVTYHNLNIRQADEGFEVTIVFDV